MMGKKCDIFGLKKEMPDNFQPWSSVAESVLVKNSCDMIIVPSKNGVVDYLIGNKVDSNVFNALGWIKSSTDWDEGKEKGDSSMISVFKKKKVVLKGINGTGAVLQYDGLKSMVSSLKKAMD